MRDDMMRAGYHWREYVLYLRYVSRSVPDKRFLWIFPWLSPMVPNQMPDLCVWIPKRFRVVAFHKRIGKDIGTSS